MSEDEAYEDDDAGPFARTRGRRGQPKGPRIYNTSRGRYGKNMGRGGKGIKRGPRRPVDPSIEFVATQNAATDAFIDERNYPKALELIQKAIAINPEVYSAHSLLSEIYFAQGDDDKAIAALLTGAHALPKEPEVWQQIADVCLQRTAPLHRQQALQSACYCFARLLQIDSKDHDARFQRAAINRQLGNRGKALKDLERLLVELPNNPSVLRQMAEVYSDMKKPQRARELYERSIAYHQSADDRESFTFSDINVYIELFDFTDEHARGIAVLKSLSRWLLGRKCDTFWDAVQEDDREWDAGDEPRRMQVPDFKTCPHPQELYGNGLPLELRVKLAVFRLRLGESHFPEALRHLSWLDVKGDETSTTQNDYADLYRDAADALRSAGLMKEAFRFYEPLVRAEAYADTAFYLAVGSCILDCGKPDEAIQFFEKAKASDQNNVEARVKLSRIYNRKGMTVKSKENAQEAINLGRQAVARPERRRYERREQREQRERAERELKTAHKLEMDRLKSMPRRQDPSLPVWRDGTSKQPLVFETKAVREQRSQRQEKKASKSKAAPKPTPTDKKAAYITSRYAALLEVQNEARASDEVAQETWLDIADELIREFQSNKALFPLERHMLFEGFEPDARRHAVRKLHQKTAEDRSDRADSETSDVVQSVEPSDQVSNIPSSYHGISFSAWLDIFLEYAMFLARMGREHREQCYKTLEAALDCTVWYHSRRSMLLIHTVWFTCAMALNDGETMINTVLRWFMREYQFMTDVYGLFGTLNLLSPYPLAEKSTQMRNAIWRAGPNQKFLFRQVKANDYYLPLDYNKGEKTIDDSGPVPSFMREEGRTNEDVKATLSYKDPTTGEAMAPQDLDIALLVLYAQILYAAGSFPNALNYFYRAHAINPKNTMVCLSICLCYIHQSFKRQSENRHMLVMQGMAFFQLYADCRIEAANDREKQHARKEVEFNQARIWNLLGLSNLAVAAYERVLETEKDVKVKSEAALALQMIYALSGDTERARDITEQWLVVE